MTQQLAKISIMNQSSLLKACDLLHDAQCDLSNVKLDLDKGIWKALFEREFTDNPDLIENETRLFFLTKQTFPLISSQLMFHGVASYEIEDKSHISIYMFNECRIKDDVYELCFCEDMKMIFRFVNKPIGELLDLGMLERRGPALFNFRNPFRRKT